MRKRLFILLATLVASLTLIAGAGAKPGINMAYEDDPGGWQCGGVGNVWINAVYVYQNGYPQYFYCRYICAPWGPETLDCWT